MTDDGALTPLSAVLRRHFSWLENSPLKKIATALEAAAPGGVRFVGGCVRDSLLGAAPKDFDIATTLAPNEVAAALQAAGLKSAPTGIEHGTITAIADHTGVEVTTLRADVSTDGRRATVAFTKDWRVDAGRRDFRINAIYLTPDGLLFDPVGGLDDVEARRVQFIGEARDRIREDYLRILRFFRFSARFSDSFDETGLAACAGEKHGIGSLSAERIGAELLQILALPRSPVAIDAMISAGVLREIWPAEPDVSALAGLKDISPAAPAMLGLAALFGDGEDAIGARLKLSNTDNARRKNALKAAASLSNGLEDKDVRVLIYRFGNEIFMDGALLAAARQKISSAALRAYRALSAGWPAPAFPMSGKDVLTAGVSAGPQVAVILSAAEQRWIGEDFPDQARAREILLEEVGAPNP